MFIFPMYYPQFSSTHSNLKISDATHVTEEIFKYLKENRVPITSKDLSQILQEPRGRVMGCLTTLKGKGKIDSYIQNGFKYWYFKEKEN